MSKSPSIICKNCGEEVEGRYCRSCGQRSSVGRVTFRETFQDLADALFTVSAPLWVTIKKLVVNPGGMLRDYLAGRRKTYYKPVSFFVLMTLIFLFVGFLIDYDPFVNQTIQVQESDESMLLNEARDFYLTHINNFLFAFVLTLALGLKLFFWKKYSLAEYVAVSFYMIGIYTLIVTLNMFYIQYVDVNFQYLGLLIMWIYFMYAMVSFFPVKRFWVAVKSLIIFPLAMMGYFIIGFSISLLIVSLRTS
ncbi:DUF3667 domain-containing protein [Aureitalea marina]|uniref:DUF3667 domain-containing protein n=1 Tax=Aureitalea marina TaxID=930804 RepID=A0A2S7KLG1_9FLAO|nr:DUF3667 domain-containing protein [Aureitalea marina]PQB03469.1 hypothetical protein BST85_00095 [Aureitalea marina]